VIFENLARSTSRGRVIVEKSSRKEASMKKRKTKTKKEKKKISAD
jgi:hypothetical protein